MRKSIRDIIKVLFSNVLTILSGVFIGFIIPKIFSVEGYGFYKTYSLYLSYIGLFSLGLIDGIVIKYGNKNLDEIDPVEFRTYFRLYLITQVLFTVVVLVFAYCFLKNEYKYIGIFVACEIVVTNITGYYQQISQITQRFTEYSLRNIIKSAFNIIAVLGLMLAQKIGYKVIDYKTYLVILLIIDSLLCLWYVFSYRNLCFGKHLSIKRYNISSLYCVGFPLLIANLCTSMILLLDRQFVSILFSTTEYAIYAFAYSIISLITVAISSISTVLYPIISRENIDKVKEKYQGLLCSVTVISAGSLILYFPLKWFVGCFLQKYTSSVEVLQIIFPSLLFTSVITIIFSNYYKRLQKSKVYFIQSFIVLGIAFFTNLVAYILFKSYLAISWASIITMIIWYFISKQYLDRTFDTKTIHNNIYLLCIILAFYVDVIFIKSIIISGMVFVIEYCILTIIFEYSDLKAIIMSMHRGGKKKIKYEE
jgi:O-antigen/teichoic acid export membrane protein